MSATTAGNSISPYERIIYEHLYLLTEYGHLITGIWSYGEPLHLTLFEIKDYFESNRGGAVKVLTEHIFDTDDAIKGYMATHGIDFLLRHQTWCANCKPQQPCYRGDLELVFYDPESHEIRRGTIGSYLDQTNQISSTITGA